MFREYVAKFFDIVRREKSRGIRALWKIFDDKKEPWKPWKDHEHRSLNSWKPWHEYWYLQIRTTEIGGKVREALEVAVATRDSFLVAACSVMNEVVLDFARERGIEVHDRIQDGTLLQREFVELKKKEDPELRAWALTVGPDPTKKQVDSSGRVMSQEAEGV